MSVAPPHAALDVARAVAGLRFRGTFVDANAIATETAMANKRLIEEAGGHFVDGGIIGPANRKPGAARIYLAGPEAAAFLLESLNFVYPSTRSIATRAFPASPASMARAAAAWFGRLSLNQPGLPIATTNTVLRIVSIAPLKPCNTGLCVASRIAR